MMIRVIRTTGPPVHSLLVSAYTTADVNLITWNKAYSVFPRQTFVNHKFYPLRPMDDIFGSILNKYKKQGWTTRDIIWPDLATDQARASGVKRRIGDSSSLVILLDTSSVQQASTPDSVIEHAQFTMFEGQSIVRRSAHPNVRDPAPQIQVQLLKSPALRYVYTASGIWLRYVTERLQRWAWVEIYKLEQTERPQQFANGIPDHFNVSLPDDFSMPESWDYADNQLPLWYQELEQRMSKEKVPGLVYR